MKWLLPLDLAYPTLLLVVTGYGYFTDYLPSSWSAFLAAHNIRSLSAMLWWITAINSIKCVISLFCLSRLRQQCEKPHPGGAPRDPRG